MPYYLPIAGGRIIGFIPFPMLLVLCEMQSVWSRIWTRVTMSISTDDNHYTTGTCIECLIVLLQIQNKFYRGDHTIDTEQLFFYRAPPFWSWQWRFEITNPQNFCREHCHKRFIFVTCNKKPIISLPRKKTSPNGYAIFYILLRGATGSVMVYKLN